MLLDRAQALGVGHPEAEAALLVAEAFACEEGEPLAEVLAARAVTLARRDGDALIESAALDVLTANELAMGEQRAGAAAARRIVLLAPLPMTPEASFERVDAYQMAAQTALGAGDIAGSRRFPSTSPVRRPSATRRTWGWLAAARRRPGGRLGCDRRQRRRLAGELGGVGAARGQQRCRCPEGDGARQRHAG